MYPTSNDYKTALLTNARAHKLRGTINGVSFDGRNVVQNSFVVRNQFCPATEISLGGVYVGELDLVFTTDFAESLGIRGSFKGKTITAEIGVELADESFEYIPVNGGTYTIEEVQWTNSGLKIVSYDNMSKFDVNLNLNTTSGYIYNFISYACAQCGVTLGMTQVEVENLPNGDAFVSLAPGSAIETYRDLISQLAVACCSFATINRNGALIFVPMPNTGNITATIGAKLRYSTTFSDFVSYYSMIEVENEDGTTSLYTNGTIGGLSMDIGSNPFLQIGTDAFVRQMRQNIVNGLGSFRSTPFKCSILPNPAIDLGDVLKFTGGIGSNAVGVVMSLTHKVNSTTIEGYGENPTVAGVSSALAKEVSNTSKNNKEMGFTYYTFTNLDDIHLSSTPQTIVRVLFATNDTTTVTLWHQAKILSALSGDSQEVEYLWYLDGQLLTYNPIDTFGEDGFHSVPHPYWFENIDPTTAHIWEVKAKTDGGTATISAGDVYALIAGQRMVAQGDWGGTWEIEDELSALVFDQAIESLSDFVSQSITTPNPNLSISDSLGGDLYNAGQPIEGLSDSCSFTVVVQMLSIITEQGDNLITEDGDNLITEGE